MVEIISLRDAVEYFLLSDRNTGSESYGVAMAVMAGEVSSDIDDNTLDQIVDGRRGNRKPDFIDDSGRARLTLITLQEVTGIPVDKFLEQDMRGRLHPRFASGMDVIMLCREKFSASPEGDAIFKMVLGDVFAHAPEEAQEMIRAKFTEKFGAIPFDYVDETGEKFITSEALAKYLGTTVEEIEAAATGVEDEGLVKTVETIPDPGDGKVH